METNIGVRYDETGSIESGTDAESALAATQSDYMCIKVLVVDGQVPDVTSPDYQANLSALNSLLLAPVSFVRLEAVDDIRSAISLDTTLAVLDQIKQSVEVLELDGMPSISQIHHTSPTMRITRYSGGGILDVPGAHKVLIMDAERISGLHVST